MRHFRCACALLLVASPLGLWLNSFAAADEQPSKEMLGTKIANVAFKNGDGAVVQLHDLKDKKAIIVVFLSFDCPVATSYSQPLAELHKEFAKRDVEVIGISTNLDESAKDLAKHVKDCNLPFPVYQDHGLKIADALKAQFTPEAFLLSGDFVLQYRGRIDDTFAARLKKKNQVTQHDLRQALAEVITGRKVTNPATVPIGCAIPRPDAAAPKVGKVTYHKDVLPILQNNCQSCHRPGEVGPFSLTTFRHAVNWASDIKEFTQSRRMPPWKPVGGPAYHDQRTMSDRDIAILAAWVDGGTPEGNPKDAPPPKEFPKGWTLGQPDLVLTMSDEFQVGPKGNDVFRCFVLPTNLLEDKHVVAVDVRPGNPRIVHHAILYIDGKKAGRKLEAKELLKPAKKAEHEDAGLDKGPGYSSGMGVGFNPDGAIGGWAPGQLARNLPDNTGVLLPKNSDIVMQLHYHRNGRLEKDKTQIGIYFAKEKVSTEFQGEFVMGGFLAIPAGVDRFPIKGRKWVTEDCSLHTVMAHMHMLGKEIKFSMIPPGGKAETLLHIKDWEYNWQETYFFKNPIHLKAGTELLVEAVFDNSAKNPHNPNDPPQVVFFGEQTTDEMCFIFLGGTSNRRGRELPLTFTAPKKK